MGLIKDSKTPRRHQQEGIVTTPILKAQGKGAVKPRRAATQEL